MLALTSTSSAQSVKFCVFNNKNDPPENSQSSSCFNHCNASDNRINELADISSVSISSEIEFYLCSSGYNLTSFVVNLTGLLRVAIIGNGSVLKCAGQESGMHFENISRVEISGVTLHHCGFTSTIKSLPMGQASLSSALFIEYCSNISLNNVSIQSSSGVGLLLLRNYDYTNISGSHFSDNHAESASKPGGGIVLVAVGGMNQTNFYYIQNCIFENNNASKKLESNYTANNILLHGGGLNVYLQDPEAINMSIAECKFRNNSAAYGGGLHISVEHSQKNKPVTVTVSNSQFVDNNALSRGGGVTAGFTATSSSKILNDAILFHSCTFTNNSAVKGGGLYLYLSPGLFCNRQGDKCSEILLENITWIGNHARYGSAVLITPYTPKNYQAGGRLPKPLFRDCTFESNKCGQDQSTCYHNGVIYINEAHILLQGKVNFTKNFDSAVQLYSSELEISSGSDISFISNSGYCGGAISLHGFASLYLSDSISVTFTNNSAFYRGGAIYHNALPDPSNLTYNCFVKYAGKEDNVTMRNISVNFINNAISSNTSSDSDVNQTLFLFSTLPCLTPGNQHDIIEALKLIGNFSFQDGVSNKTVKTFASQFLVEYIPSEFYPGLEQHLNITLIDDMNNIVQTPMYRVALRNTSGVKVNQRYAVVTDNNITLLGKSGSTGIVELCLMHHTHTCHLFDVILSDCPPGYVYHSGPEPLESCVCADERLYTGIQKCNSTSQKAELTHGYWAGYIANEISEENFRTSSCPLGYCNTKEAKIELPFNETELEIAVCGNSSRRGKLCSLCDNGTVLFYGSYTCEPLDTKKCKYGPLFFILTQLVPVTFLFLVVTIFHVELTSGELNGFLFYVQTFNILTINAFNFILFPKLATVLLEILNFIFGIFNLHFLKLARVSFCLFEDANIFDALSFDYITVFYSLILIVLTVLIKRWRCYKINEYLQKLQGKRVRFSQSIIHGLSGLLVMCYARTTTTALKILSPVWLYKDGKVDSDNVRAFYHGEMKYFDNDHKKYAIPALFMLTIVTVIPPLLLLVYPLCYRVLALLKLEESKFTVILCKVLPLEKFKPLFDSFQGAFKDKHRYFAGLYFVYRLAPLLVFVMHSNLSDFYMYLEIQLVLMLAVHLWVQPYKKKQHNRFDSYIFLLLLLLNSISLYNFHQSLTPDTYHWAMILQEKTTIDISSTAQVLLAYFPLVVMVIRLARKVSTVKILVQMLRRKLRKKQTVVEREELTLSMLDYRRETK